MSPSIGSSEETPMLPSEAVEVLDKMREGADILRNNTNSYLSGEVCLLVNNTQSGTVAAQKQEYYKLYLNQIL